MGPIMQSVETHSLWLCSLALCSGATAANWLAQTLGLYASYECRSH